MNQPAICHISNVYLFLSILMKQGNPNMAVAWLNSSQKVIGPTSLVHKYQPPITLFLLGQMSDACINMNHPSITYKNKYLPFTTFSSLTPVFFSVRQWLNIDHSERLLHLLSLNDYPLYEQPHKIWLSMTAGFMPNPTYGCFCLVPRINWFMTVRFPCQILFQDTVFMCWIRCLHSQVSKLPCTARLAVWIDLL